MCGGVCEDMGAAMGGKGAGANNRGQELLQGHWRAPVGLGTLLQWGKLYPAAGSVRSTFNIMSPITGLIFFRCKYKCSEVLPGRCGSG